MRTYTPPADGIERNLVTHTVADAERIAGRSLTDREIADLRGIVETEEFDNAFVAAVRQVTDVSDQNVARFTRGDAEKIAGRPLTDSEYRNLVKSAEFSSMREAFTEVVYAVVDIDDADDDDTTP